MYWWKITYDSKAWQRVQCCSMPLYETALEAERAARVYCRQSHAAAPGYLNREEPGKARIDILDAGNPHE